jgi:glycosyltransferase involved in cell wall biosynthesis
LAGQKTRAPTIAFITVCRGRLHHLRESLPKMAAQRPDELIVVDYDCPDKTGEWVEANVPQATVVRGSQPDGGFNISRARNLGAAAAKSEWLFFVDADILLGPQLGDALRTGLQPGNFYQPAAKASNSGSQIYGSFACTAADFAAIGGYDEVIEGWGREDKDLYLRLMLHGVQRSFYSSALLSVIKHGDAERHVLPGMNDRWQNEAVNAAYVEAKQKISLASGGKGNLGRAKRRTIMDNCRRIVGEWYLAGAKQPLPVRFIVAQSSPLWLASRMRVRSEITVTVVLEPPKPLASAQPGAQPAAKARSG